MALGELRQVFGGGASSGASSSAPAVGGGSSTGGGAPGVGVASSNAAPAMLAVVAQSAPAPAVGGTAPTTPALHPPPGLGLPPQVAAKQRAKAEHQRKQHQPLVVPWMTYVGSLSASIPVGPACSWSIEDMVKYLDAIALGHLNPIIRANGLDGGFFLQCSQEDLQSIGIGQVQWKKIRMYMPQ